MLVWIRPRLRPVAVVLLAALVAVSGASAAGHGSDCHGAECAAASGPHDPSAHGIGTPSSDASHPLHCVLCHWTRLIRPSTEAAHYLARPTAGDVRPHADVLGVLSLVQAAQPPLRSPPSIPAPIL